MLKPLKVTETILMTFKFWVLANALIIKLYWQLPFLMLLIITLFCGVQVNVGKIDNQIVHPGKTFRVTILPETRFFTFSVSITHGLPK